MDADGHGSEAEQTECQTEWLNGAQLAERQRALFMQIEAFSKTTIAWVLAERAMFSGLVCSVKTADAAATHVLKGLRDATRLGRMINVNRRVKNAIERIDNPPPPKRVRKSARKRR